MVNDATTGTDEDVNTASELLSLLIDVATTVDSEYVVFTVMMLQSCKLLRDLEGELSRGRKDHGLRSTLSEEAFLTHTSHHWQAEAEGLTRPSKISNNHVFFVRDSPECFVLHREEFFDLAST